jgi:hypothetical protein
MFPSNFLEHIRDRMYSSRKNPEVGVFDIDWDSLRIELKESGWEPVGDYYHNLKDEEDYPRF